MKTEYTGSGGFLQRDGVEHKEYAEAYSAEIQKAEERDGADLLEKVLTPIYEPKLSEGGCGYRPHRSAKDEILKVKKYADEGYRYEVMIEPPCTERYARWCERSAAQLMGSLLLDLLNRLFLPL